MKLKEIVIIALFISMLFASCGKGGRIKTEIFEYIQQSKDEIPLDAPFGHQSFEYRHTGSDISSVDYGYYYTDKNEYLYMTGNGIYGGGIIIDDTTKYKNGYRADGINNDPTDWYYTEKICDNWYYYELHDG